MLIHSGIQGNFVNQIIARVQTPLFGAAWMICEYWNYLLAISSHSWCSSQLAWFFWRLTSTSARSPLHGRYTCCFSTGIVFVLAGRWEVPDEEEVSLSEGSMSSELSNSAWLSQVIQEGAMSWLAILAAFCKYVKVTMWDVRASLFCSTAGVSARWGDSPSWWTLSCNSILKQINHGLGW